MSLLDLHFEATLTPESDDPVDKPWPVSGRTYHVVFEVEHIGPNYDDTPSYTILHAPDEVHNSLYDVSFEDLIDKDELPIASGIFEADLEFWMYNDRGYFDTHDEWVFGYHVSNMQHIP